MYMPVSIDATILHIAIPTLSMTFQANTNQLLWVLDIYALVMAGLLLPMGALGDRIGYRRLMLYGAVVFALASLLAGMAQYIEVLIFARVILAVGASMILPATLSGIRHLFEDEKSRGQALAVWSTVGISGAAMGPLVGGYLLEHYYWGSVFLINLPIILIVGILFFKYVPKQAVNLAQTWQLKKALRFVAMLLILVYGLKTLLRQNGIGADNGLSFFLIIGTCGALFIFIKRELSEAEPMIDFRLLNNRVILMGVLMALIAMISLVGFELVMAQELQFVHGLSPLRASIFMLPLMLASATGGFLASWLTNKSSLRMVGAGGILLSALAFAGLGSINVVESPVLAMLYLMMLGVSVSTALFASTAAIMSAVSSEQAASAGAIESMAYELGAGFGVVFFGLFLSLSFSSHIQPPSGLSALELKMVTSSIHEALHVAHNLAEPSIQQAVVVSAKEAFIKSHQAILWFASGLLVLLTLLVWQFLPRKVVT